MTGLDVFDLLLYFPSLWMRGWFTNDDKLSVVHHVLGIPGMLVPLVLPLWDQQAYPDGIFNYEQRNSAAGAISYNSLVFANRFVFIAELSSIPLQVRNVYKLKDRRTDQPLLKPMSPAIRTAVDIWFAVTFLGSRTVQISVAVYYVVTAAHGTWNLSLTHPFLLLMYSGFSLLNLYWSFLICKVLARMIFKQEGGKTNA